MSLEKKLLQYCVESCLDLTTFPTHSLYNEDFLKEFWTKYIERAATFVFKCALKFVPFLHKLLVIAEIFQ